MGLQAEVACVCKCNHNNRLFCGNPECCTRGQLQEQQYQTNSFVGQLLASFSGLCLEV